VQNILQGDSRGGVKPNQPRNVRNDPSLHVGGLPEKSFYDLDLM